MRKVFLIVVLTVICAAGGYASDFSVNLNVNYNYGVSDFFDESRLFLSYDGQTFVERRHNYLGFGLNVSVTVPIIHKVYVVPGFSIKYGHQDYEYSPVLEDSTVESDKNTFFFKIFSGELNLVYDLLTFKGDWIVQVLAGLTYNQLSADEGMNLEERTYWGFHPGIGLKFLQMKHFGFQLVVFYEIPFDSELFSYVNSYIGIMYRF
jgi:hypothetical protein